MPAGHAGRRRLCCARGLVEPAREELRPLARALEQADCEQNTDIGSQLQVCPGGARPTACGDGAVRFETHPAEQLDSPAT